MKISLEELRKIVSEELASASLSEAVDHKSINAIVTIASKLLEAIGSFRDKASGPAVNAVTPHLEQLEKVLEDMVSSPGSYVPQLKKEPKKVTLKAVKT